MRYRNNRRGSTAAKHQKLKGVKLPPGVVKPSNDEVSSNDIDNQESIEALQKLFEGRASAPIATVQSLLDETRGHRNQWLQRAVSIHTILKTYPVFKLPKWVCLILSSIKWYAAFLKVSRSVDIYCLSLSIQEVLVVEKCRKVCKSGVKWVFIVVYLVRYLGTRFVCSYV